MTVIAKFTLGAKEMKVSHRISKKGNDTFTAFDAATGSTLDPLPVEAWNNLGNLSLGNVDGTFSVPFTEVPVMRNPTEEEKAAGITERIDTGATKWHASLSNIGSGEVKVNLSCNLVWDSGTAESGERILIQFQIREAGDGKRGKPAKLPNADLLSELGI